MHACPHCTPSSLHPILIALHPHCTPSGACLGRLCPGFSVHLPAPSRSSYSTICLGGPLLSGSSHLALTITPSALVQCSTQHNNLKSLLDGSSALYVFSPVWTLVQLCSLYAWFLAALGQARLHASWQSCTLWDVEILGGIKHAHTRNLFSFPSSRKDGFVRVSDKCHTDATAVRLSLAGAA